jgi:lipoprotein-releasing system permease protein
MLSFRIAARFLRKSPVQSFLIVAGIAIGIGVQVFLGSLIIGLQENLVDQTVGGRSQVTIEPRIKGGTVIWSKDVRNAIGSEPEITTQVPVRTFSALLTSGVNTMPLQFTGGDIERLDTIYNLTGRTVAGKATLTGRDIIIGKNLAEEYAIRPADDLQIVLPDGTIRNVTISAVVDLGSAAANTTLAFMPRGLSRLILNQPDEAFSEIQTQVKDVFKSADVAASLRKKPALAEYSVTEWQAQNGDLLTALRSQSSSSYTIQFFVLLAVALGIASTLAISAVQKTRQIGILKAMGMRDRQAGRIFFWQAATLGVIGSGLGVAIGVGIIWLFSTYAGTFTFTPKVWFTALSFVIGVLVAVLSSLIPSRRTAKLDPIEVIQGG